MKMTAGSPNPASAWVRSRTPVKYRASDAPIATSPTGIRFEMNARTTTNRIANVIAMSLMSTHRRGRRADAVAGPPRRSGLDRVSRTRAETQQEPHDEQQDPGDAR